jgi:MYXO-CTERM domain-containing protein
LPGVTLTQGVVSAWISLLVAGLVADIVPSDAPPPVMPSLCLLAAVLAYAALRRRWSRDP